MATVARTPDAQLLTRLRARDRDAWEELYVEYQPRLRGFAYSLAGNAHDADDLVQETFVRAVPRLDKLDPETADIGAYLFTTARNLYLKQIERERRQQPVAEVPEPALPTPIEDDPVRSTLLVRQQDEVRRANAKLQPRQRLVLALRELEDRSYAEIGELVGMKENAVAQLIFRARESLRTELRLLQVDPERLPEECRRYLPLLAAHLDGQLKGAKRDETLAHLDGCERCQASLADMREASRRYRSLFPPLVGGEDAKAAIDARLTSAGYWDRDRHWLLLARRMTPILAIVAAGLVLGGGGTALGVALSRGDSVVAATTTTDPRLPTTTGTTTSEPTAPATSERATTSATTAETGTQSQPTTSTASEPGTTEPGTTEPATTQPAKTVTEPQPEPGTTPTTPPPPPDTTPPVVRITSGAPGPDAASVKIAFTANEKGVTFACKLDGEIFHDCGSPLSLRGFASGPHTFFVRATDKAGNVSKPASVSWMFTPPDTTPPVVTILTAPPASTTQRDATFTFSANEPAAFACSLDGAAFAPCTSGITYQRVTVGAHTFSVRATDPAGNTGQASHSWTIVVPRPDLVISAFTQLNLTVTNRGNASAASVEVRVTRAGLVQTFKTPVLAPGALVTFSWSTCRTGTSTAVVDPTQLVVESDETNNTATRQNTCLRG